MRKWINWIFHVMYKVKFVYESGNFQMSFNDWMCKAFNQFAYKVYLNRTTQEKDKIILSTSGIVISVFSYNLNLIKCIIDTDSTKYDWFFYNINYIYTLNVYHTISGECTL